MDTLKLLPRWCRFLGLVIIIPTVVAFLNEPGIAFGDTPSFFDGYQEPAKMKLIALVSEDFHSSGSEFIWFEVKETEIINEVLLALMLIGTWLVAFAKIKDEDEFSGQLRLQSMVSAIVWNSIILLFLNFTTFDGIFLYVMVSQLFSFLLIFSVIFALKVRKQRSALRHEE